MAKVHKQPQLAAGRAEVIENLRPMFVTQRRCGLELEKDFVVANEIGTERLNKRATAVLQSVRRFGAKRNALEFKFNLQAFVVNRFVKPASLVLIDRETGAHDYVAFMFINQFWFLFVSCHFVCFVGEVSGVL